MDTASHSWHRQPGETTRQHQAFLLYLEGLTQVEVANKLHKRGESASKPLYKKPPGQIAKWASRNNWTTRRQDYLDHLDRIREQAVERQQDNRAVDWEKRRAALDEQMMELGEKMILKAREMLNYPVVACTETTVEWHDPGKKYPKTVHSFKPGRWTFNSIGALLTVADQVTSDVVRRRLAHENSSAATGGKVYSRIRARIDELEARYRADEEE